MGVHGWHCGVRLFCLVSHVTASFLHCLFFSFYFCFSFSLKSSATDVSAQATMKGVAKCDKHFELQSSVSQQKLERTLRSQEIPESTPASVPTAFTTSRCLFLAFKRWLCVIARQSASFLPLSRTVHLHWCGYASVASSLVNLFFECNFPARAMEEAPVLRSIFCVPTSFFQGMMLG